MSTEQSSTANLTRGRGAMMGLLAGIAGATVAAIVAVIQCTRELIALFGSSAAFERTHSPHTPPIQPAPLGSPPGDAAYSVFTATMPDPLALTFLTVGHLLMLCAVLIPAIMIATSCVQARREQQHRLAFPRVITRSGMIILVLGGTGSILLTSFAGAISALDSPVGHFGIDGSITPAIFWQVSPTPFLVGAAAIMFGLIARTVHQRGENPPTGR